MKDSVTSDMSLTEIREASARFRTPPMTAVDAAYRMGRDDYHRNYGWDQAEQFAAHIKPVELREAYLNGWQDSHAEQYKAQCPVETCIES
jgi:hypothetical protein